MFLILNRVLYLGCTLNQGHEKRSLVLDRVGNGGGDVFLSISFIITTLSMWFTGLIVNSY